MLGHIVQTGYSRETEWNVRLKVGDIVRDDLAFWNDNIGRTAGVILDTGVAQAIKVRWFELEGKLVYHHRASDLALYDHEI